MCRLEDQEFLRSQHKMALELAVSFLNTTSNHACKADLERIIAHNEQCILEIDSQKSESN